MKYQLLVSTMNQRDFSICNEMKISSDAIIINQADYNDYKIIDRNKHIIEMYSFNEKGIGLSRNSAFMRSSADIIEFADDDMIFVENYENIVIDEFKSHPEADAILFNIESMNPDRPLLKISKFSRVNRIDALKYGCARLVIRREAVLYNNLSFSLLFGGGAIYGSGEDTVFLQDAIRAGLKIYKSPVKIADVKQDNSTWFHGYTDQYYIDKGALFAQIFPSACYVYAFFTSLKNWSNFKEARKKYTLYRRGIGEFQKKQRRS